MEGNALLQGFGALLLIGLPALAARDVRPDAEAWERAAELRRAVYVSIAVSLLLIAALTWAVAAWQGVPPEALGWRAATPGAAAAWALGTTGAGILIAWGVTAAARRLGFRESALAHLIMPRDAREKRAFLVVAGVGATCEEYVYRGFLLHGLIAWTGSVPAAVAVTAVSFGFAHGYQRVGGIVRASLLGVALALPVVWTGSLLPAVVAHFWINAAIGLGGWRRLLPEIEDGEGRRADGAGPEGGEG